MGWSLLVIEVLYVSALADLLWLPSEERLPWSNFVDFFPGELDRSGSIPHRLSLQFMASGLMAIAGQVLTSRIMSREALAAVSSSSSSTELADQRIAGLHQGLGHL